MPRPQPIAKGSMGPSCMEHMGPGPMDVRICLGCPPVILFGKAFHKISGHTSTTITSAICTAMLYRLRQGRKTGVVGCGCSIPPPH